MIARSLPSVMCLLAAFTLAGVAHADDGRRGRGGDGQRTQRSAEERPLASERLRGSPRPRPPRIDDLADSVRRVQSRTGGQVLSAERVPFDGRDISRVKVVDEQGRVRVYMDDPASRRPPRRTRGDDD